MGLDGLTPNETQRRVQEAHQGQPTATQPYASMSQSSNAFKPFRRTRDVDFEPHSSHLKTLKDVRLLQSAAHPMRWCEQCCSAVLTPQKMLRRECGINAPVNSSLKGRSKL